MYRYVTFIQAHFIFNMLTCVYAAVFLLSKGKMYQNYFRTD